MPGRIGILAMRPPDRATIRTELPAPADDLFGFLDLSRNFPIEANTFITSVTSTDSDAHGQRGSAKRARHRQPNTDCSGGRGIRTHEDSHPS